MSAATRTEQQTRLFELARQVRDNPHHREAIAAALELIADAMGPCIDCGAVEQDAAESAGPDTTEGAASIDTTTTEATA